MKRLKSAGCVLAWCLTLAPLQAAGPEFEVATVKPAPMPTPGLARHVGMAIEHGRVDIAGIPLLALLQVAFRVRPDQLSGPDWMASTRFDILAKMPDGASEDQVPEMLQALLADRFKLTVHRETKEQPAYALVVSKGGIKAKEIAADAEVPSLLPSADDPGAAPSSEVAPFGGSLVRMTRTADGGGVIGGLKSAGMRITPQHGRGLRFESPKITCTELAQVLAEMVNRQVIDATGSKSFYQISLDISFEEMMAQAQGRDGAGPGRGPVAAAPPPTNPMGDAVVAAVQKLGLRLESRKLPTEMIVVDHADKTPSEN